MLSEEALEARNKDFRRNRELSTMKCSHIQTMTDLLHSLLYSSDPLISSLSKKNLPSLPLIIASLNDEIKVLLSEELQYYFLYRVEV